jgi:hypothetical protein
MIFGFNILRLWTFIHNLFWFWITLIWPKFLWVHAKNSSPKTHFFFCNLVLCPYAGFVGLYNVCLRFGFYYRIVVWLYIQFLCNLAFLLHSFWAKFYYYYFIFFAKTNSYYLDQYIIIGNFLKFLSVKIYLKNLNFYFSH